MGIDSHSLNAEDLTNSFTTNWQALQEQEWRRELGRRPSNLTTTTIPIANPLGICDANYVASRIVTYSTAAQSS